MKLFAAFFALMAAIALIYIFVPNGIDDYLHRRQVAQQLVDPDSAKFRNRNPRPGARVQCGEVNGRNRMGGYAGFARYISNLDVGRAVVEPQNLLVDAHIHHEFLTLHDAVCGTSIVAKTVQGPPADGTPDVDAVFQACLAFVETRDGHRPDSALAGDMTTATYGRDAVAFVLRMSVPPAPPVGARRSITCYGQVEDGSTRINDVTSP